MKIEDHDAIINKIIAGHADATIVTDSLTKLRDDYKSVTAEKDAATTKAEKLEKENMEIRERNMELFLRIGTPAAKKTDEDPDIDPDKVFSDVIQEWRKK